MYIYKINIDQKFINFGCDCDKTNGSYDQCCQMTYFGNFCISGENCTHPNGDYFFPANCNACVMLLTLITNYAFAFHIVAGIHPFP